MPRSAPPCIAPRAAPDGTLFVPRTHRPGDPFTLFAGSYKRFFAACREVDEPGVVAIAIDENTGALVGVCGLRACFGRPAVAVLGRHERCDLRLWGEDVALRHVAIVVDPVRSWAEGARVGYRVLDLRTEGGLIDEIGRPLRSFRADGPAIVRCGGQLIFVLPIGDPTDWPPSCEQAWAMLPERVYLDECGGVARPSSRTSVIFRTPPVSELGELCSGELAGTLEIEQRGFTSVVALGKRALRDGVLLGRYERCDLLGQLDESVSRVHALMLQVGKQTILADLASTHGFGPDGGGRARIAELVDGSSLWLARETRLRWRDSCRLVGDTSKAQLP
jgi:hypothetical protein